MIPWVCLETVTQVDGTIKQSDMSDTDNPNKDFKRKIAHQLRIRQLFGFEKVGEPPRRWSVAYKVFEYKK